MSDMIEETFSKAAEYSVISSKNVEISCNKPQHLKQENDSLTSCKLVSIDENSKDTSEDFLHSIFSEVKATLAWQFLKLIPDSIDIFILKNGITAKLHEIRTASEVLYILSGSLEDIISAHAKLKCLVKKHVSKISTNISKDISQFSSNQTINSISDHSNNLGNTVEDDSLKNSKNDDNNINSSTSRRRVLLQRSAKGISMVYQKRTRVSQRLKFLQLSGGKYLKKKGSKSLASSEKVNCKANDVLDNNILSYEVPDSNDFTSDNEQELFDHKNNPERKRRKDYEAVTPFKHFCKLCSFKTKRISHFNKHMAIHDKVSTLFKCNQCNFTSVRLGHLRRHEMSHSSTVHQCAQCSYKTDHVKFLTRHIKQKHHQLHLDKKQSKVWECAHCSYKTTRQYSFDRHQRIHGPKNRVPMVHQCNQCCYKTQRKEHYIRHVNNVHNNKRPYLCHLCGKAFKRGDALRQHHQTHRDSKMPSDTNFKCEICDKSFRSQSHLYEHQAVHSDIRSFLCEICGASFKTRSVQRKHVLTIHKHPRSHSCEVCNRRFNTQYALKRHQKVHEEKSGQINNSPEMLSNFPQSETTNLNALSVMTLSHNLQVPPVATLQMPSVSADQLSSGIDGSLSVQDAGSGEMISQTFLHASEATTALLYLTNSLTHY